MKLEEGIIKAGINNAEAARILNKAPSTIGTRIKNGSELTVAEMVLLENATGKSLYRDLRETIKYNSEYDLVTIPYLEIEDFDTLKFKVSMVQERVQFDREIIEHYWNRIPENLRWFPMLGNTMNFGEYPLANNDVLIIDISSVDTLKAGIYVYTTKGGIFINGISKLKNGNVQFIYTNQSYETETYTPQELKEMEFKLRGRMVKNLSLTK